MPPTFQRAGVLVKPLEEKDRFSLYEAVRESIDTVGVWMSWCHAGYSINDADQWLASCAIDWQSGSDREFGILDSATGQVLGCAGVNQINRPNNFANLGYWVRASRTGQGVATTAATMVAAFAFYELKLTRLEVVARIGNSASRRVAEKIGCRFEGIARHRLLYQGCPHDAAVYSLLPIDIAGS